MNYLKNFEQRFPAAASFDSEAIQLNTALQTTSHELNEANAEIDSLRTLIDEMYKQSINNVMDIGSTLDEANSKINLRNIPFPKNRDTISYAQKAGYSQFAAAFYSWTTTNLIERYIDASDSLSMINSSIRKTTIKESTIKRTGMINLPDMADEPATTKLKPAVQATQAVKPQTNGASPKPEGVKKK